MENLTDTLLNIFVFVFVGVLIRLYVKDPPREGDPRERPNGR